MKPHPRSASNHGEGMPSTESRLLAEYGMASAALFYRYPLEPLMRRAGRVARATFEHTALPPVIGGLLYPWGRWTAEWPGDDPHGYGLRVNTDGYYGYDEAAFGAFTEGLSDPFAGELMRRVARDARTSTLRHGPARHLHAHRPGEGDHYIPHFPRILREGFAGYRARIVSRLEGSISPDAASFQAGLLDALDGLAALFGRFAAHIRSNTADARLLAVAEALAAAPHRPPETFLEALAVIHALTYFTSHEPGRLDQTLEPFYRADLAAGRITRPAALALVQAFFANIDGSFDALGVSAHLTLGGSHADGSAAYGDMTRLCLEASSGFRKPDISLLVRDDMPPDIWEMALRSLGAGSGNPALKNDALYLSALAASLDAPREEIAGYAFCGCTETTIPGVSAVDSTWAVFNPLLVLEHSLNARLPGARDFAEFLDGYKADLLAAIRETVAHVNFWQEYRALFSANPVRSVFTDDCIERGLGYYAGGARFNISNVNVTGLTNVANSLAVVRRVIEGKFVLLRAELLEALRNGDAADPAVRATMRGAEKFGNGHAEPDGVAAMLSRHIFAEIARHRCRRGNGVFQPSIIGFVVFAEAGRYVGATPDGRPRGAPVADSAGPSAGTDRQGPTAALLAVAGLAQAQAPGTCVMNVMLAPGMFRNGGMRNVKAMVQSYFAVGGMQIQFSVVSRETLQAAMREPERYRSLIVRVGGFNGRFVEMSGPIQEQILERTVHDAD